MTESDEILAARRKRVDQMDAMVRERKIILGAISFLLGATKLDSVDNNSTLEDMRIDHIDRINSLIFDKKDLAND